MSPSESMFDRYIGIDYSGAETAESNLPGLRIYVGTTDLDPVEVPPPSEVGRYWTRQGIAAWLVEQLAESGRAIVGIDHGFSFPIAYFERHGLEHDWPMFLDDFRAHWPTDRPLTYVDFIREGVLGNGAARCGLSTWRRLTEVRTRGAKSVFHFDVPGQVAKSTHSGLPWLRFLQLGLPDQLHFWPFDGWAFPADRHVIVEVYPALWKHVYAREDRNSDQHDAYSVAAWFRDADRSQSLVRFCRPSLTDEERAIAEIEGWIFGVM